MDPLTITSTVILISARCVQTARALYDLRGKYKDAPILMTAIYTETTVIATSLASIQSLCTRNPEALRATFLADSDLSTTFDQALTGCVLVYSVLDEEVQRIYAEIAKDGLAGIYGKVSFLWREDMMKDVLTQIRGQQTALSLLIQLLQMNTLQDVQILLQNNTAVLQNVAYQTGRFRRANPKVKAPSSVFQLDFDDVASLYTTDSSATSTDFAFDDLVVNSQAYRRALLQSRSSQNLAPVQEQSETSSDSATIVEGKMSDKEIQRLLTEHEILKEKYQKVKRYFFEQQSLVYKVQAEIADLKKDKESEVARLAAEKELMEHSRKYLEEESKRYHDFFEVNEIKRKALIESHGAELKLKAENLSKLQTEIEKLQESIAETKSQDLERKLSDANARAQQLSEENDALVDELQRYKTLDPIIEQLRLLSPKLPSSPGNVSAAPGSARPPPMT